MDAPDFEGIWGGVVEFEGEGIPCEVEVEVEPVWDSEAVEFQEGVEADGVVLMDGAGAVRGEGELEGLGGGVKGDVAFARDVLDGVFRECEQASFGEGDFVGFAEAFRGELMKEARA